MCYLSLTPLYNLVAAFSTKCNFQLYKPQVKYMTAVQIRGLLGRAGRHQQDNVFLFQDKVW